MGGNMKLSLWLYGSVGEGELELNYIKYLYLLSMVYEFMLLGLMLFYVVEIYIKINIFCISNIVR